MTTTTLRLGMAALLAALIFTGLGYAQVPEVPPYNRTAPSGEPPPVPEAEGEPQTRGPVHEGFAQPGTLPPGPGQAIDREPPAPIEEVPPETRPEGDNVAWLPGYWAWDDERKDFLWVSGTWRVVPPGRKWVPGYWAKTADGHTYVHGMWADASVPEVPYMEEPPPSLERGPVEAPPDDDSVYVPGVWMYRDDRFLWRPGYWLGCKAGWIYNPPHWCWTPRGYLFCGGFWDRPLDRRGMLFAPYYFPRGAYRRAGFRFSPGYVVGVNPLLSSLWVRRGWGYAYGDYYGAAAGRGFRSWAVAGAGLRDPLYGYYRFANRGNPAWARTIAATYRGRLAGDVARPPRTFTDQARLARAGRSSAAVVSSLSAYRTSARTTTVTRTERVERVRTSEAIRKASVQRRAVETTRVTTSGRTRGSLAIRDIPAPRAAPRVTAPPRAARPTTPRAGGPTTPREGAARSRSDVPRYSPYSPSAPRVASPPRSTPPAPAPRVTAPPRPTRPAPSAPRYSPPAPRVTSPPRYTPPAPRYTPPAAAPRVTSPPRYTPPAPRYTPPAPRYTPPAPRYSAPPPRTSPPRSGATPRRAASAPAPRPVTAARYTPPPRPPAVSRPAPRAVSRPSLPPRVSSAPARSASRQAPAPPLGGRGGGRRKR